MSSKPEIDVAGMTGVPGAAGTGSVGDNQQDMSFADMLSQLEEIVNRLESGELSLEESLAKFEEGVQLARKLESILARAESRVQEILKKEEETSNSETEELDDFSGPCKGT